MRIRFAVMASIAMACGVSAASADAVQRYASPTGVSTNPCTALMACDLKTAVEGAAANDEVIVMSSATPYTETTEITDNVPLTIHGVAGLPAPVINTSGYRGLIIANGLSTIRLLDMRDTTPGGGPLIFAGLLADQFTGRGGGSGNGACDISAGTLRDSVCVASDPGAGGVLAGAAGGTITLRNVTAINTNATSGSGLLALGESAGHVTVNATNLITDGVSDISASGTAGGTSAVTLDHSDYAVATPVSGSTITDNGGHQSGAPAFVNPAGFDYRQAAGSPTIGTGIDDPVNGPLDVEGDLRVVGTTDIGADEFTPAPAVAATTAAVTGPSSAMVTASVNPNGAPTSYSVHYGTTAALGSSTSPFALTAGTTPQPVSVALSGLAFGTTYHYALVASNHAGTGTSPDQTLTTTGITLGPGGTTITTTMPPPPARPIIRALSVSPSRFAVSTRKKGSKRPHVGASLHVTLSEKASVRLAISHATVGRKVGTKCQKLTRANAKRPKCPIYKPFGSLTLTLPAGASTPRFSGKVKGKSLPAGIYRISAVATASGGAKSDARTASFTILPG